MSNLPTNQKPENKPAVQGQERLKSMMMAPAVKARFEEMLGKKSAGFISSVLSAVSANKELEKCDPRSVIASAAIAASMDLPVNPSLGMAHIVPYKGIAQFQMGWKGYVQLAMRSGQYKNINATKVHEGQIKNYNAFTGEMEFDPTAKNGKIVGFLLYFKLLNGYEKYFYMTVRECEDHGKRYSQTFKRGFGVWVDNFDAMALKTVVKLGLSKYGILSLEMQKAMESDVVRDVTPAGNLIQQMAEESDLEKTNRDMDTIAVDTVPDYENETQETQNVAGQKGDPGEFLVKSGPTGKKQVKLKDIPRKQTEEFLSWAYQQETLTEEIKKHVEAAEAYLEQTAGPEAQA